MDERRKFVSDWLKQDWTMSDLCAHYSISRKTGYKWLERFKAEGSLGLNDESRAPLTHPNSTPPAIESKIVDLRHKHPFWGPRKLKARLERVAPELSWPCNSTIGEILKRHNLVQQRRRRSRTPAFDGPFVAGLMPNDVWRADFKGWFKTKDGTRIDPLTVTDAASHCLIRCQAVDATTGDDVRGQFTAAFQEYGMPQALKTDNGSPFASVGLGGLSRLSVWLIRLGIRPERIRPGHPEDNGSHERMHRDLKAETAKPPRENRLAQQRAFDHFRIEYNEQRPHESIGMQTPADVYQSSPRVFPKILPEIEYAPGSVTRQVTGNGTIKFWGKWIYVSTALEWERIRIEEETLNVWYGPMLLGELDLDKERVIKQPTKVLPMCPV